MSTSRGSIEVLATALHEFGRAGLWCRRRLAIGLLESGFRSAGLQRQRDAMLRLLCAMLAATPATASCVFENARYTTNLAIWSPATTSAASLSLYISPASGARSAVASHQRCAPSEKSGAARFRLFLFPPISSEVAMKEHYAHQLGGWIARLGRSACCDTQAALQGLEQHRSGNVWLQQALGSAGRRGHRSHGS